MKKKICAILLLCVCLRMLLSACGKEKKTGEYQVFYLNADVTRIIPEKVELKSSQEDKKIEELLKDLKKQPQDASLRQTIPNKVKVLGVSTAAYQITVDFSKEYYDMSPTQEVLTRAAIVKTLLQIKKYPYVMFTVESEPLVNSSKNAVGSMSEDSFVENPGEQITTLTLYFSSKDGTKLVPETREVHYSSNISLEKLVMEQLMEGPKTKKKLATIPTGTKLITITVVDGVCYVNMDETFQNQNQEISEQVVLYSIVDSLTELSSIDKVQISINGDTSGKCRYTYDLAPMYKEDMSIVENGQEEVDSTQ